MQASEPGTAPVRPIAITLALGLSTFLTLFDVTAVVVAMPGIAKSLDFTVTGVAWVIDAYSLAFTAALLAAGSLADRYGRRRSMLSGNALFLVASVACAVAPNGPMLLGARVFQGIGAAFMATGAIALVAGAFPTPDQRARAFGALGVIGGVAMALGPTLGGLLASWLGWRWIFYANIPFCAALALAVPRLVGESRDLDGRPLDLLGIGLLTIAVGLAVDSLLRRDGATGVRVACATGSVIAALLFVVQQRRSSRPVFDPLVFATPAMLGVGALLTALQFGYWAVLVYLPLFLSAALNVSMDIAGVALLAATLPMLLVPLIGGRLATRWGMAAPLRPRLCHRCDRGSAARHRCHWCRFDNGLRRGDHGNGCHRSWRGTGQSTAVERSPRARATKAGRHGGRCSDGRAPGRIRDQHRGLGRDADDNKDGNSVCSTIRARRSRGPAGHGLGVVSASCGAGQRRAVERAAVVGRT